MISPTVPVEYAKRLLQQAQSAGCDVAEIYRVLDLDAAYFDSHREIPAQLHGQLYQLVMRFTQDEWFGIFAEGKVPLGAFRMMCLSVLGCSNLQQAIIRGGEFAEICRGLMVRYHLEVVGELAVLSLSPSRSLSKASFNQKVAAATPESLIASTVMWHRMSEWLIGVEIPLLKMSVTFSKEDSRALIDFPKVDGGVEFSALQNSISYDQKYLEYPVVQNESSLMAFLRTAPYHLITEDPSHVSVADKVRNILKRDVTGSMPSAEQVASQLNMSVTTMRRQLLKDETSYQKIKDECRMEAAFHYLSCFDLSNNDVAEMLGFDEPSAFFRSFKKWTGQTPGEYRANLKMEN